MLSGTLICGKMKLLRKKIFEEKLDFFLNPKNIITKMNLLDGINNRIEEKKSKLDNIKSRKQRNEKIKHTLGGSLGRK